MVNDEKDMINLFLTGNCFDLELEYTNVFLFGPCGCDHTLIISPTSNNPLNSLPGSTSHLNTVYGSYGISIYYINT